MAVEEGTRLSYIEAVPDEKAPTKVGRMSRAVAMLNRRGLLCRRVFSDNSSPYKSQGSREASQDMGL